MSETNEYEESTTGAEPKTSDRKFVKREDEVTQVREIGDQFDVKVMTPFTKSKAESTDSLKRKSTEEMGTDLKSVKSLRTTDTQEDRMKSDSKREKIGSLEVLKKKMRAMKDELEAAKETTDDTQLRLEEEVRRREEADANVAELNLCIQVLEEDLERSEKRLKVATSQLKEAESRAESAERSVQKLQEEVERLEDELLDEREKTHLLQEEVETALKELESM